MIQDYFPELTLQSVLDMKIEADSYMKKQKPDEITKRLFKEICESIEVKTLLKQEKLEI